MASIGHWHRHMAGMYSYIKAGKVLANVQRNRGHWEIIIYPLGSGDRQMFLPDSPHTYREAKEIAKRAYCAASRNLVKAGENHPPNCCCLSCGC